MSNLELIKLIDYKIKLYEKLKSDSSKEFSERCIASGCILSLKDLKDELISEYINNQLIYTKP
jgi:hypothetical protein